MESRQAPLSRGNLSFQGHFALAWLLVGREISEQISTIIHKSLQCTWLSESVSQPNWVRLIALVESEGEESERKHNLDAPLLVPPQAVPGNSNLTRAGRDTQMGVTFQTGRPRDHGGLGRRNDKHSQATMVSLQKTGLPFSHPRIVVDLLRLLRRLPNTSWSAVPGVVHRQVANMPTARDVLPEERSTYDESTCRDLAFCNSPWLISWLSQKVLEMKWVEMEFGAETETYCVAQ